MAASIMHSCSHFVFSPVQVAHVGSASTGCSLPPLARNPNSAHTTPRTSIETMSISNGMQILSYSYHIRRHSGVADNLHKPYIHLICITQTMRNYCLCHPKYSQTATKHRLTVLLLYRIQPWQGRPRNADKTCSPPPDDLLSEVQGLST